MTPQEYVQLKAFARQDGALLSLLWIGALVCYIQGLTNPLLGMAALVLIVISPFSVLTFFYAGLLLALALYVYFAFIDKGYLLGHFTSVVSSEEGRQVLKMYGMAEQQVKDGLQELAQMRPIDYALNMLTVNITTGFLLGLPIAALMKRQTVEAEH